MMMNDNELNENQVDYECFMKIIKFIISFSSFMRFWNGGSRDDGR